MKIFCTTLSLILVLILTGTVEKVKALTKTSEIAQNQDAINNYHVYPVLFNIADIKLKDKEQSTLTGRLTVFDSKNKTIQVSLSTGDFRLLPIYQIQQITFRQTPIIINGDSKQTPILIIRGSRITLSGIPLDAFVLLDAKEGQASIDLTKMVNETKKDPIPPLEADEILYVEEIQFESQGKMTIKVKLINRQIDTGE